MQVLVFALKTGIGQDVDAQVEVTGRRPGRAGTAFAAHAHPGACLGPGRDLHLQALPVLLQDPGCTLVGLLQGNFYHLLIVASPLGAGLVLVAATACGGARGTAHAAEYLAKEVREGAAAAEQVLQIFGRAITDVNALARLACGPSAPVKVTGAATPTLPALPVLSQLVIFGPLLRVGEDLVGFVDLFEAFLGLGIIRVHVGVMLPGQPAKCLLDLFDRGILVHAEDLVIVLVFHQLAPLASRSFGDRDAMAGSHSYHNPGRPQQPVSEPITGF